jgi:hypothetical protein
LIDDFCSCRLRGWQGCAASESSIEASNAIPTGFALCLPSCRATRRLPTRPAEARAITAGVYPQPGRRAVPPSTTGSLLGPAFGKPKLSLEQRRMQPGPRRQVGVGVRSLPKTTGPTSTPPMPAPPTARARIPGETADEHRPLVGVGWPHDSLRLTYTITRWELDAREGLSATARSLRPQRPNMVTDPAVVPWGSDSQRG